MDQDLKGPDMRHQTDTTALLRTLIDDSCEREFDPDSPAARASLERILTAPPLGATHRRHGWTRRRGSTRRLALAGVPVALAAGGLVAALSLGGSRTSIAQAAVLSRAAAALEQPNVITYLQVQDYSAHGGMCVLGGQCAGFSSNPSAAISAEPANDSLTYSSREWRSPDGSRERAVYSDGDEMVRNGSTHEYAVYDPADNTLTTLTRFEERAPAPSGAPSPLPSIADIANPSYYESLYRRAQAGEQSMQLIGQTAIGGRSVYELRVDITQAPPAHPPAGDMCGHAVCASPKLEILLYLDSHTFTPVRTVTMVSNTNNSPGIPAGTSVSSVTDFTVESLPDTPANESLLQMSPHPGAEQVKQTEAQYRTELGARLPGRIARAARRSPAS
jgi:hypothetical protein